MDKKLVWIGAIIFGAIALLGLGIWLTEDYEYKGVVYQNPQPAPEIVLEGTEGKFFLSEQKGKVILLFFGYASCPDICPTTLSDMKQVYEYLGEDSEKVKVVFITVDPERDTIEKVGSYVDLFNEKFIGLSGSEAELTNIWNQYGVIREIDTASDSMAGYLVNHSTRIYLIDPAGRLFITYSFGTPIDEIGEDIQNILKQNKN
jgi:protein SCO1/2